LCLKDGCNLLASSKHNFCWYGSNNGQYEDLEGESQRILFDIDLSFKKIFK